MFNKNIIMRIRIYYENNYAWETHSKNHPYKNIIMEKLMKKLNRQYAKENNKSNNIYWVKIDLNSKLIEEVLTFKEYASKFPNCRWINRKNANIKK